LYVFDARSASLAGPAHAALATTRTMAAASAAAPFPIRIFMAFSFQPVAPRPSDEAALLTIPFRTQDL
jgi:hypothetical protein